MAKNNTVYFSFPFAKPSKQIDKKLSFLFIHGKNTSGTIVRDI